MQVKYGDTEVSNGNLMPPSEAQETPTVSWPVEDDTMYTLCMIGEAQQGKFSSLSIYLSLRKAGNEKGKEELLERCLSMNTSFFYENNRTVQSKICKTVMTCDLLMSRAEPLQILTLLVAGTLSTVSGNTGWW